MDSFEGTRLVAIMSTFSCGGRDLGMKLGSAFIVSCLSVSYCVRGRIKLFGTPRQWKHFRPLFQAVFLSGGVLPPRQSNTTPPSPKTEI